MTDCEPCKYWVSSNIGVLFHFISIQKRTFIAIKRCPQGYFLTSSCGCPWLPNRSGVQRLRKADYGNKRMWTLTRRACARRSMLSSEMFRASRSTCATKVRCRPASSARSSCDHPLSLRNRTMFNASSSRAEGELGRSDVLLRDIV